MPLYSGRGFGTSMSRIHAVSDQGHIHVYQRHLATGRNSSKHAFSSSRASLHCINPPAYYQHKSQMVRTPYTVFGHLVSPGVCQIEKKEKDVKIQDILSDSLN